VARWITASHLPPTGFSRFGRTRRPTSEVIWKSSICLIVGDPFPLTLTLSLGEREQQSCVAFFSDSPPANSIIRFFERLSTTLPLPAPVFALDFDAAEVSRAVAQRRRTGDGRVEGEIIENICAADFSEIRPALN